MLFEGFEEEMELLWQTFRTEASEHIDLMEDSMIALEQNPLDQEALHQAFRSAHTLKGNALTVNAEVVARTAGAAEDVLELLRDGTLKASPSTVSTMLRVVDALRDQLSKIKLGEGGNVDEYRDLIAELEAQASGDAAPAAGPETAGLEMQSADLSRTRTLRVDVDRLDELLDLTGEIAIARGRLSQALAGADASERQALIETHQQADHLYMQLQELVMKVRMVPVGPTFRRFNRVVRDLAANGGKPARLVVEGGDVEVDTTVIEQLRDPLTHMVRNAFDHGLEDAAGREAAGKPPVGTITLSARHEPGSIVIRVADDGVGIDRAAVAEKAKSRGLVDEAADEADLDLAKVLFEPGFTTNDHVTDLSGRGVGLDVVLRRVEDLRGALSIDTEKGRGTAFTIRLPLTLAIIEGLEVAVGNETYYIPHEAVLECVEVDEVRARSRGALSVTRLRSEALPFVRLRRLFGGRHEAPEREIIVVVQRGDRRAGIAVDSVHGAGQTVIKPLGRLFRGIPWVSGSAILGNGRVALILDVPALFERALGDASVPVAADGVN